MEQTCYIEGSKEEYIRLYSDHLACDSHDRTYGRCTELDGYGFRKEWSVASIYVESDIYLSLSGMYGLYLLCKRDNLSTREDWKYLRVSGHAVNSDCNHIMDHQWYQWEVLLSGHTGELYTRFDLLAVSVLLYYCDVWKHCDFVKTQESTCQTWCVKPSYVWIDTDCIDSGTNALKSTTFNLATTLALIYICISVHMAQYDRIVEQEKILIQQKHELSMNQMQMMIAQIQPHFLYNSLTALAQLCSKDPKEAKKAIINFADYWRNHINAIDKKDQFHLKKN